MWKPSYTNGRSAVPPVPARRPTSLRSAAGLAAGRRAITRWPASIGTPSKIYMAVAVAEHVPMEMATK